MKTLLLLSLISSVFAAPILKDFDKPLEIPNGKIRLVYKWYGEPVRTPRSLKIFVKCDNSEKEFQMIEIDMCYIKEYHYEQKKLVVDFINGRSVRGDVYCDVNDPPAEFPMGEICE